MKNWKRLLRSIQRFCTVLAFLAHHSLSDGGSLQNFLPRRSLDEDGSLSSNVP
jgi:hypothetical protein